MMESNANKLELLRGFVMSEIENFFHHQVEEDYTYEELLELEEQIGKVSQGFSQEELNHITTRPALAASQCSICLSPVETGSESIVLVPCEHEYHPDCIKSWLQEHKTCPLCLQEVILR
jgi:hypothetical protein